MEEGGIKRRRERKDVGVQTERGGEGKKRWGREDAEPTGGWRDGGKRGMESLMNSSRGALGFLISSRL